MEDDDIAAAMGFSSFGGTKKRKFDHTNSPKAKADASGANTTRLGVRPKKMQQEMVPGLQATDDEAVSDDLAVESPGQPPSSNAQGKQPQPAATGLAAFLARGKTLQDTPSGPRHSAPVISGDKSETVSFGGPSITQAELNTLRHGIRNKDGDLAYFLASFVEDPWEKLGRIQK